MNTLSQYPEAFFQRCAAPAIRIARAERQRSADPPKTLLSVLTTCDAIIFRCRALQSTPAHNKKSPRRSSGGFVISQLLTWQLITSGNLRLLVRIDADLHVGRLAGEVHEIFRAEFLGGIAIHELDDLPLDVLAFARFPGEGDQVVFVH